MERIITTYNTISIIIMPCQIHLRQDQSIRDREKYSCDKVTVFAPSWVKEALSVLGAHLKGITFELLDNGVIVESFTITETFNEHSLIMLERIARNERSNVTGVINASLYSDIKDTRILYSIRDLVRQCVVAGVDSCSRCGGYGCSKETQTMSRCYICDLAALQFQQPYNSGRLVLIQEDEPYEGILDDLIFERVVGERKLTFQEVTAAVQGDASETTEMRKRYIHHDGFGMPSMKTCFLDTYAYSSFVKKDVILSGLAICQTASTHHPEDKICFKFLKYGTGFFAGIFGYALDRLILSAVLDGLEELFKKTETLNVIKHVELPFYKSDNTNDKRIASIHSEYGVRITTGTNDALKATKEKDLVIATTNCGDNHVVCGNKSYSKIFMFVIGIKSLMKVFYAHLYFL